MQILRSVLAVALVGLLTVACGGTPGPTVGPGGATQNPGNGGQPTENVAGPTQGGGGGGGKPAGWDQYGKASWELSAPIGQSGEVGFVPAASRFAGQDATSLSFFDEAANVVLTIAVTQGVMTVSFGGEATGTVIGTNCTTSNLSIQATSASGSFVCTETVAFLASGASVTGVTIKGNFNGHG